MSKKLVSQRAGKQQAKDSSLLFPSFHLGCHQEVAQKDPIHI